MPVEIREIVIKTEVKHDRVNGRSMMNEAHWQELRAQILSDCKKMINKTNKVRKSKR